MGICLACGDNCMYKHKRDVNQFMHNEDITCRGRPIDMRGSVRLSALFSLTLYGADKQLFERWVNTLPSGPS